MPEYSRTCFTIYPVSTLSSIKPHPQPQSANTATTANSTWLLPKITLVSPDPRPDLIRRFTHQKRIIPIQLNPRRHITHQHRQHRRIMFRIPIQALRKPQLHRFRGRVRRQPRDDRVARRRDELVVRADRHAEQDVVDEDGLAGDDGGRVVGGRGLECEGRVELAVLRQDVDLDAGDEAVDGGRAGWEGGGGGR